MDAKDYYGHDLTTIAGVRGFYGDVEPLLNALQAVVGESFGTLSQEQAEAVVDHMEAAGFEAKSLKCAPHLFGRHGLKDLDFAYEHRRYLDPAQRDQERVVLQSFLGVGPYAECDGEELGY